MNSILFPIIEIGFLSWAVHGIWKRGWQAAVLRKTTPPQRPSLEKLQSWAFDYGMNTNAFMATYPGFEYFTHPGLEGAVAYIDTPNAWVGGGEPLGPPSDAVKLLVEFSKAAARFKKRVLLIPIRKEFAERVVVEGNYQPLLVGSDPTFNLGQYPRTGKTWIDVIPSAKQFSSKNAKVIEFKPAEITSEKRKMYDQMVEDWLGTRKTSALGFLNQVDPWLYSKSKRYFSVELGTKTLAFIAAIPVRARGGWYLIDVIRRPESPPGSTEFLLLQTMRLLLESGAKEVTMGVCPLSAIGEAEDFPISQKNKHRLFYGMCKIVYEHGNQFYNFKPLHQFKLKFLPTHSEPVYLIYKDDATGSKNIRLEDIISIARAWMPKGLLHSTGSGFVRMLAGFDLSEVIKTQLTTRSVVKSVPPNLSRLLSRCKLTVALIAINTVIYGITSNSSGILNAAIESKWGYTWSGFLQNPVHALLLSPFLHWNLVHILTNLFFMAIFTGGLEYLAGTPMTLFCYVAAMLLTNPATSLIILTCVKPWCSTTNMAELDLGASLGIFGCAGALTWFVKHNRIFFVLLVIAVIGDAAVTHVFLADNHVVALLIGLAAGGLFLRN